MDNMYGWGTRVKVDELLVKIRDLSRKLPCISFEEDANLKKYTNELEDIRKKCSHSWYTVKMFYTYRRYCRDCEKEDKDYKWNGY